VALLDLQSFDSDQIVFILIFCFGRDFVGRNRWFLVVVGALGLARSERLQKERT
jgi:hypothetical protein